MTGPGPLPADRDRAIPQLDRAVRAVAICGGVLMLAAALVVTASVALRAVGMNPIAGDFEIVQMAMAVIVFAFLPICQIHRGNIAVATFTDRLPRRAIAGIAALWDGVYAIVAGFLAIVLTMGALEDKSGGTATMVLAVPLWPAILACATLAAFLAAVAIVTAKRLLVGRR
jgi:TRAP-type C4-dicarboxylate transport system permease small subunit